MKVLLLAEVSKVGHKGEIADVSEGFAKNFLLKKKLAQAATAQIISEFEQKKSKEVKLLEEKAEELKDLAGKLNSQVFQFHVKVGKHHEIFSSVHGEEIKEKIAEYLKKHGSQNLTAQDVQLETKPLKELGTVKIAVKLGRGNQSQNVSIGVEILSSEA
jgi:large subunit ribosomal protein L9